MRRGLASLAALGAILVGCGGADSADRIACRQAASALDAMTAGPLPAVEGWALVKDIYSQMGDMTREQNDRWMAVTSLANTAPWPLSESDAQAIGAAGSEAVAGCS